MPKKPPSRPKLPQRNSEIENCRLLDEPSPAQIADLLEKAHYVGSPKHKRHPHLFGPEPFNGKRGDETLCDEHAGFKPSDMAGVKALLERGIKAGLIGPRMLWSVASDGWIYSARITNSVTKEYHGFPIRPTEAIAEMI